MIKEISGCRRCPFAIRVVDEYVDDCSVGGGNIEGSNPPEKDGWISPRCPMLDEDVVVRLEEK